MPSELNALIATLPPWTTDANGAAVPRNELREMIINEVCRDHGIQDLLNALAADSRKSYSKAKILEFIEDRYDRE